MSQWPMVKLGDVCTFSSGGTPNRKKPEFYSGTIPWISSADINENGDISTRRYITDEAIQRSSAIVVPPGTLLLVTRTGVGKVSVSQYALSFSQDITAIEIKNQSIDKDYLVQTIRHFAAPRLLSKARGATILGVKRNDVSNLEIPLPPLEEQRRIAHILEAAQKNISAAKFKSNQINSLRNKISNLYSTDNSARTTTLSSIAEITSGITKGRKIKDNAPLTDTPYLAVSNVKDGYLDLSTVSSIPITAIERDRYLLKSGDILLTEGGDPDKLGRGAIWKEEIAGAIHQNHIFKVRLKKNSNWNDNALLAVIRSARSRAHFFRSAKQTTGIATINKRQLSATPIPELSTQTISLLSSIEEHINHLEKNINKEITLLEELHQSLATRAFAGQL